MSKELSEKDELIKTLRDKQKEVDNISVKDAIEVKLKALKDNKTVTK